MKPYILPAFVLILSVCLNCEKEHPSLSNGVDLLGQTKWEKTDTTTSHFAPAPEAAADFPLRDARPIPDSVFVVGRATSYLRVQHFEPVFVVDAWGNDYETFYLDAAQETSFSLYSSRSLSSGGLNVRSGHLSLPSENGLEYSSHRYTDSTFICMTPDNWTVHYNNLSEYQCMGQDSFIQTDEHIAVRKHQYGFQIDQNDDSLSFNSGSIRLAYLSQTFSEAGSSSYFTLGLWNEEPFYVVLRQVREDKVRYGWLLLSVKSHNRVHLHEMAWPVD